MVTRDGEIDVPPGLIVGLAVAGAVAMLGVAWMLSGDNGEMVVLSVLLVAICPVGPLLIGWMAAPRPATLGRRALRFLLVLVWGSAWCLWFLFLAVLYVLGDDTGEALPWPWWALLAVALVAAPLGVRTLRRRRARVGA
jgi:hypothetical protein